MSIVSSDQSNRTSVRAPYPVYRKRRSTRRVGRTLAREVRHQKVIKATFDRAEAYARVGDFEQALEWLDRAAALSGGLSRPYRALRARWAVSTAVRLRPAGGDQNAPRPGGLQSA